jgi:hypothetical protein
VNLNWLSGFWGFGGVSGVAYHNNWVTNLSIDYHGDNWVISTDQNNLYRSNGADRTIASGGTPSYAQLSVNWGGLYDETSDWAVAEVIVYTRTLTGAEIVNIEQYLKNRYNL